MGKSYWNKFDKRAEFENKKRAIRNGADDALSEKRKKQNRYIPADPFNLLLKSLMKASSNESRREDS